MCYLKGRSGWSQYFFLNNLDLVKFFISCLFDKILNLTRLLHFSLYIKRIITFSTYERTMFSISWTILSCCPSVKVNKKSLYIRDFDASSLEYHSICIKALKYIRVYLLQPSSTQEDLWGLSLQLHKKPSKSSDIWYLKPNSHMERGNDQWRNIYVCVCVFSYSHFPARRVKI